jgi:hypothetical protein
VHAPLRDLTSVRLRLAAESLTNSLFHPCRCRCQETGIVQARRCSTVNSRNLSFCSADDSIIHRMWTRQRVRLQCRIARQSLLVQASQCDAVCSRRYKSASVSSGQEDEVESLELQRMGQSPQLRSLLAGPAKRADVVVKRPIRFSKPGLARDLLKYLKDFPHALLLCRVGQFYEVSRRDEL